MSIRIVVADDHTLVREVLCSFLADQPDMDVVGQAGDGATAMELAMKLEPDVIVMDIGMPPVLSGLEATRWIRKTRPNVKIIALSMHDDTAYVVEMLRAGAHGYMLKDGDLEELLIAIRTVARGETYVGAGVYTDQPARP